MALGSKDAPSLTLLLRVIHGFKMKRTGPISSHRVAEIRYACHILKGVGRYCWCVRKPTILNSNLVGDMDSSERHTWTASHNLSTRRAVAMGCVMMGFQSYTLQRKLFVLVGFAERIHSYKTVV
jgi:hypothetical protein